MPGPTRLVVCVNQRLGSGQRSCVGSGNLEHIARIEAEIESRGLDIPIIRRECLGKCEQGPVMRIAPGGPFFVEITADCLPRILDQLERFARAGRDDPA